MNICWDITVKKATLGTEMYEGGETSEQNASESKLFDLKGVVQKKKKKSLWELKWLLMFMTFKQVSYWVHSCVHDSCVFILFLCNITLVLVEITNTNRQPLGEMPPWYFQSVESSGLLAPVTWPHELLAASGGSFSGWTRSLPRVLFSCPGTSYLRCLTTNQVFAAKCCIAGTLLREAHFKEGNQDVLWTVKWQV